MRIRLNQGDRRWLCGLLFCASYIAVLFASGCPWADGPLAFVRGCYRYGIDWNAFMAPLGLGMILVLMFMLIYAVCRLCELAYAMACWLIELCRRTG